MVQKTFSLSILVFFQMSTVSTLFSFYFKAYQDLLERISLGYNKLASFYLLCSHSCSRLGLKLCHSPRPSIFFFTVNKTISYQFTTSTYTEYASTNEDMESHHALASRPPCQTVVCRVDRLPRARVWQSAWQARDHHVPTRTELGVQQASSVPCIRAPGQLARAT